MVSLPRLFRGVLQSVFCSRGILDSGAGAAGEPRPRRRLSGSLSMQIEEVIHLLLDKGALALNNSFKD